MQQPSLTDYLLRLVRSENPGARLINSSYDNVVVQSDNQVFRWSLNKSFADVKQEASFIDFLGSHDSKVADVLDVTETLLPNSKDTLPLTITAFISHSNNPTFSTAIIRQAAEELYRIHEIGTAFCRHQPYTQQRRLDDSLIELERRLDSGLSPSADNRHVVYDDVRWARDFIHSESATDNPSTILHNDFRPQNILIQDGELAAVIDFDYAVTTRTPQKDVAHAALEWSFPDGAKELNLEHFRLFVTSYAAMRHESYETYVDNTSLVDWVRASALIDAAGYWLHSPDKTMAHFGSYMYAKFNYFQENRHV